MQQTVNLDLPYIMPSQAQKHITHNEAIRALDILVQLSVKDRNRTVPASAATEGQRHIVGAPATGEWVGHENSIAAWQDGIWAFYEPQTGWLAWDAGTSALVVFNGSDWIDVKPVQDVEVLGINAVADSNNRLTVKSPGTLLDSENGSHRLAINKAESSATTSIVFQTAYSGRAEFGLPGTDNFCVKTSPDGTQWHDALIADSASGVISFPSGIRHALTNKPISNLVFTPGSDGEVSIYRNDTARIQNPRQAVISAVNADILTLTTNASPLFFHSFMRNVSLVRIWNISRTPVKSAWVRWNPADNQLQVTEPSHISGWLVSDTIQVGDPTTETPNRCLALDISPLLANRLGAVFRQSGLLLKVGIGGTAAVTVAMSDSGVSGSFLTANSPADGLLHYECIIMPSTVRSPISNSNLVFVRETATATALGTTLLSVAGVFV